MAAVSLTNPYIRGDPTPIGSPVTWKMPMRMLLAIRFSITVHAHALDQNNDPFIRLLSLHNLAFVPLLRKTPQY